jgi:hypothetical protein
MFGRRDRTTGSTSKEQVAVSYTQKLTAKFCDPEDTWWDHSEESMVYDYLTHVGDGAPFNAKFVYDDIREAKALLDSKCKVDLAGTILRSTLYNLDQLGTHGNESFIAIRYFIRAAAIVLIFDVPASLVEFVIEHCKYKHVPAVTSSLPYIIAKQLAEMRAVKGLTSEEHLFFYRKLLMSNQPDSTKLAHEAYLLATAS